MRGSCIAGVLAVALGAGCGKRVMAKGTGASGKVTTISESSNDRLDLINRLTDDYKRSFDRLHEPFAKVFQGKLTKPPKGFKSVADFQKAWDELKFASVEEDQRYVHQAVIRTDDGEFDIRFNDMAPNHVRSFIVLAKAGFFDGTPLRVVNDMLVMGSPDGQTEYELAKEPVHLGLSGGAFVVVPDKNGKSPTRFGLTLREHGDWGEKVSLLGGFANQHVPANGKQFDSVVKAAKVKPITIKKVDILQIDQGKNKLFTAQGVNLPEVDAKGDIRVLSPQEKEEKAKKAGSRKSR